MYSMGHRNGHGLAVNPETGDIWETEQGPSGGDELNIIRVRRELRLAAGELRPRLLGSPHSERPTRSGFEDPEVVWLPSIGLAGMTFYTGDRFPHWKRNVFVAGLREGGMPRTGQLQQIVFNGQWRNAV